MGPAMYCTEILCAWVTEMFITACVTDTDDSGKAYAAYRGLFDVLTAQSMGGESLGLRITPLYVNISKLQR